MLGLAVLLSPGLQARAQTGSDYGIAFATIHRIDAGDSQATVIAKAAKTLPRANQEAWMRLERTFFIHYGPNAFRGVEWGTGHESPSVFNPTELNADQWVRTVKEAGGTMIILVCKHHDGFALWPTRYTDHSVKSSPWRNGKGDEVGEVAAAARKYGIRLGVYLSPADLYQHHGNPTNPNGYYGDGSAPVQTTIPTSPATFLSNPARGRTPPPGRPIFRFAVDDYNRYFLNQLYELLTQYGPISEVWFDGANPDASVVERYDYSAWYGMIRKLVPNAIIFGKGPDGRWVGNEEGIGRKTEWDVIPLPTKPEDFRWPDMTDEDLGSLSKLVPSSYLWWYPAEINMPILHGWFWSPSKVCRTAAELVDRYYTSVGRNGNWLLNISPDTRGLIPDDQIAQLKVMSAILAKTFVVNLASGAHISADSAAPGHNASRILDGSPNTWWQAAPGLQHATLTLHWSRPITFDVISLQESVNTHGQRIARFAIDAKENGNWRTVAEETTVGHKRLLRLAAPVTATEVHIRILDSRLEPTLSEFGLFRQPDTTPPPSISGRNAQGFVIIETASTQPLVYTLDGSLPNAKSAVYHAPLDLRDGGIVLAALLKPDGSTGMVGEQHFAGLAPLGWKTVDTPGNASAAVDDNPATVWETPVAATPDHPVDFTVDMGVSHRLDGFTYSPREDGNQRGTVERYRFQLSEDGVRWTSVVPDGNFDNMRNNPDQQEIHFQSTQARYFRLVVLGTVNSDPVVSAKEISVLPAYPAAHP